MRYLILGLFAALAIVAPVAQAAPAKTLPLVALISATKSAKSVRFGFDVLLTPDPAKCGGTLTVSHRINKKRTVSWSGKLTSIDGVCGTAIYGKLPKSNYGKTRKFKFRFPGSKSIKKFSSTQSFKLVPPKPIDQPPVLGPPATVGPQHPGPWFMLKKDDISDSGFSFTLGADRRVPMFSRASGLPMTCASGNVIVPFNWSNTFFGMGTQDGVVTSGDSGLNTANMVYSVTWHFNDAHSGTGHFSANGDFRIAMPDTYTHCTADYDVTFSGGNP